MIPSRFAQKHDIERIADMTKPAVLAELAAISGSGTPQFHSCIANWSCAAVNDAKLKAYGLNASYHLVTPESAEVAEETLALAQKGRQPIFGYWWSPISLMGRFDWTILKEPEYTVRCWNEIPQSVESPGLTPSEACAYETIPVHKGINSGLRDELPEVANFLELIDVGNHPVTVTAAWAVENGIEVETNPAPAAEYYLKTFTLKWPKWVSADAAKRLEASLALSDVDA